jgi:hypothetical protein
MSIPRDQNPALDRIGSDVQLNQNNAPVYFLCQTYDDQHPGQIEFIPNRSIIIPKIFNLVFMPIINWISILGVDGETDEELLLVAKKRMDVVANLEITADETKVLTRLERYRFPSPFFDLVLPENNLVGIPAGVRRAVSDGYWIIFEPLRRDVHLSSFGSCSSGATKIGVQYNITFD